MLTINADGHEVIKHFHKPEDEKQSIVVLNDSNYQAWLHADHNAARGLLKLAPSRFGESEPKPLTPRTNM